MPLNGGGCGTRGPARGHALLNTQNQVNQINETHLRDEGWVQQPLL